MSYQEVYNGLNKKASNEQIKKLASIIGMRKKAFGEAALKSFRQATPKHMKRNAEQFQAQAKQHFDQAEKVWPNKTQYKDLIQTGTAVQLDANRIREAYKKALQKQMDDAKTTGQRYQQIANYLTPGYWTSKLFK